MKNQPIARRVGRVLERFPRVHASAKHAYFLAHWCLRPQRSLVNETSTLYEIISPFAWAGVPDPTGHYFFGYYDKSPWSPDGVRFLLHSLAVPRRSEDVSILVLDSGSHEYQTIARSAAWNFQQGAMSQWIRWRGSDAVAFNDIVNGFPVARILTPTGESLAELEHPIQCSTIDGSLIASVSFERLTLFRPEYGYSHLRPGVLPSLEADGLFLLDATAEAWSLRIPLSQIVSNRPLKDFQTCQHWLNHVAFAPDGQRLVFLHRWGDRDRQHSRLYALDTCTNELVLLLDGGIVSHYCWLDSHMLLCYCETVAGYRYHTIDLRDRTVRPIVTPPIAVLSDGHPSYSNATGAIVTDTYPDKYGNQRLFIISSDLQSISAAASLSHPPRFRGTTRCDLHPRWHPSQDAVSFDSVMTGTRQSWILRRRPHAE
jgi:hypothetical protein